MGFGGLILPIAIAIAIAIGCQTEIYGFSQTISPFRKQYQAPVRFAPSVLHARVYRPDGSVVGDDVFDNPDNGAKPIDEDLLESLKASVGDPSIWNLIACAFAPPPHDSLTPEVVRDAIPVGFSDSSIDIAVAVPASVEGGSANAAANQLVRVLVKVGFPQAWAIPQDSTNDETIFALVGQIRILEGFARDRLSQKRTSSGGASPNDPGYYEKMVIEQRWSERLAEEPLAFGSDLPEWWTAVAPPFASLELMDEAKLLKKLLNEDEFEDELRALFVEHIESDKSHLLVLRVAVASIGSSGLFLRARLASATAELAAATSSEDENDDSEAEIVAITAVPYSNPHIEAKTAGELREGVLLLIESVDPMPMPVRLQATAASKESEGDTITPFNEQVMEMFNELELENEATTTLDGDTKDDEKETTVTAKGEVDDVATLEADDSLSQGEDTLDGDTKEDEKETTVTTKGEGDDAAKLEADDSSSQAEDTETSEESTPEKSSTSEKAQGALSKQQPRPPDEEVKLAAKYAAIEDLGERAFAILRDLGMV